MLTIIFPIARVYTGVHWPTDVLASFVIGIVSAKIMWLMNHYLGPITNLGLRIFSNMENMLKRQNNTCKHGIQKAP